MKKQISILFLFLSVLLFAQVSLPTSSQKGLLITKTNERIYYQNLKYFDGKVTFFNVQTKQNEFLYDASISEIKENEVLVLKEKATLNQNFSTPKLTSDIDIRNYLLNHNDGLYVKGKNQNSLGTGFLIGGGACFAIGGILNLSSKSTVVDNGTYTAPTVKSSGGVGSIPLIIGLAGMGTGLILKINGSSQIKKAINKYKTGSVFSKENLQENLLVVANNNGCGLQLRF